MEKARHIKKNIWPVFQDKAYIPCPNCHTILVPKQSTFNNYFRGVANKCGHCQKDFNLWDDILEHVREFASLGSAIHLAGATRIMMRLEIKPNEVKEVNLEHWGVPPEAEIVGLNLTSNGNFLPDLLHGNEAIVDVLPTRINIFARPIPPVPELENGPIQIMAHWITGNEDDTSIRHVIDAARQFTNKRYRSVVVPAHIAVEAALTPIVYAGLKGFSSKDRINNFLKNGATFSHQVNILFPILCFMIKAPKMSDDLRGRLNRLRELRNEIAHTGTCEELTKQEAAELLVSAIFAIRFGDLMRLLIKKARKNGRLPNSV